MGCKECDGAPMPGLAQSVTDLEDYVRGLVPAGDGRTTFKRWVFHWVGSAPQRIRKEMSYDGALRCRRPLDPIHYVEPLTRLAYFDPTNEVYSRALLLMCPELSDHFNENSLGDIVEAWLALGFHRMRVPPHRFKDPTVVDRQVLRLYAWIEEIAYTVYWLTRLQGDSRSCSPKQWATSMRARCSLPP